VPKTELKALHIQTHHMILKIFYNPWKVVGFHEILLSLKIIHSEKKDIQVQYKDH
jgi:hypothetical protein